MKAVLFTLSLLVASTAFGEPVDFCVPAGEGETVPCAEDIYTSSGTVVVEVCVHNDSGSNHDMHVTWRCKYPVSQITKTVPPGEGRCHCCKVTEVDVCTEAGAEETCGTFTTQYVGTQCPVGGEN